jgi:hypothetical protein
MRFTIIAALVFAFAASLATAEQRAPEPKQTAAACDCPDNRAKDGSRCGKRSAYCRPGGAAPNCYPSDRTEAQQKQRRIQACGG